MNRSTLWTLLIYFLVAASSHAQNPAVYTDPGAWAEAVADSGDLRPIGVQTFEDEKDTPVGVYPNCLPDPSGMVGYSSFNDCTVAVQQLIGGGRVLRPSHVPYIEAASGVVISAIGFETLLEGFICPTPPKTVQVFMNVGRRGGGFQFGTPANEGFIGFVMAPDTRMQSLYVVGTCGGRDALTLLDNIVFPGGPASSLANPIPPVPCPPGAPIVGHCFVAIGPGWYDPPVTNAYDFKSTNDRFLSINDFPPGFAGPFTVTTGGLTLGSFGPGQSVQFPYGGVQEFRISGISPAVDGENPFAFPINLTLDKVGATFAMVPVTVTDSTPPVVTYSLSPSPPNGWNSSNVTVSWAVSDPESAISSTSGCGPTTLSSETPGTLLTCSATNDAGLSSSNSTTVRIDRTMPVIVASSSPVPNGAGWNNTNVTVSFACADALSGVNGLSPTSATFMGEGGSQAIAASCSDNAGNSAVTTVGGINIDKTKPTVSNIVASPNPAGIGNPVTVSAALTDLGGSNLAAAEYSVNGAEPAVLATSSGPSAQVSGALPTFLSTGVYNVCVRARDVAGNIGADECLFLPVYDPAGGFVTGGGWINSPAGAYPVDPALAGKATFGFESRYKNGASVPTGNTQFQFRVGNLNFKSTDYDWLVIAGARVQYKGRGTINGVGNYNFMLTAIDGQAPGGGGMDRFRIKIWSGGVIYDNQLGSGDSENPTTALGGGSIVIHKQ